MSFLLFAPKDIRDKKRSGELSTVPDEDFPLFQMPVRSSILKAIDNLSRDTYNLTGEVLGDGPQCWPLWRLEN